MQPHLLRIVTRAGPLTAVVAAALSVFALTAEPASAQPPCSQPLSTSGTCTYQGQSYNYSCSRAAGTVTCNVSGPTCSGALTYNIFTGKFGGKCASIASAGSIPTSVQVLATTVRTVSQVSLTVVQSQFQNIRDSLQSRLMNPTSRAAARICRGCRRPGHGRAAGLRGSEFVTVAAARQGTGTITAGRQWPGSLGAVVRR